MYSWRNSTSLVWLKPCQVTPSLPGSSKHQPLPFRARRRYPRLTRARSSRSLPQFQADLSAGTQSRRKRQDVAITARVSGKTPRPRDAANADIWTACSWRRGHRHAGVGGVIGLHFDGHHVKNRPPGENQNCVDGEEIFCWLEICYKNLGPNGNRRSLSEEKMTQF